MEIRIPVSGPGRNVGMWVVLSPNASGIYPAHVITKSLK